MIITTIFDSLYLDKGLVMIESLLKYNADIEIHALALDFKSFDVIKKLNFLKAYFVEDLEKNDEALLKAKNRNVKSELGEWYNLGERAYYCYTLTTYFTNYILEANSHKSVLYCDADLLFYESLESIKKEIGEKSCGLVSHRNTSAYFKYPAETGNYNVGIVFFKNNEIGINISRFWKELMLNCKNQFSQTYGKCGDQKYLELFEIIFGKENVHEIEGEVAHGAPWNFEYYTFISDREIIYNLSKQKQRIIFNHFSHFNIKQDKWLSAYKNEWNPETLNNYVFNFYENYHKEILEVRNKYNITNESDCPYPLLKEET